MSDLVNLKIDGKPVQVPKGTLVVDAAARVGIEIPIFCYHEKMDPVGACRMCLVEIGTPRMGPDRKPMIDEKTGEPVIAMMPKLQTACTSPVSEGMVVVTGSKPAADGRRAVLEFLLTNHPLDCPVCDKGGECPLQDNTFKYGPADSRFIEVKRHFQKPIELSDRVVLDRERCILCYRCVRFQAEIAGDESLTVVNRGSYSEIGVMPGKTFDSNFSGNTIEMCPVGALTSTKYRFKARPWDISHVPSVCAQCSVGCNVTIDVRQNEIMRLMSRENLAVDDSWLCDRGRFTFDYVHAPERLQQPLVRRDGELVPVSWEDVLRTLAHRIRYYTGTHGANSIAGLATPTATNEELYLFNKLFRQVIGSDLVDHMPRPHVEPVEPAVEAIRGSIQGLESAGAILLIGANPVHDQPVLHLRLRKAITKQGAKLVLIHSEDVALADDAVVRLKPRPGTEAIVARGLAAALVAGAAAAEGEALPQGAGAETPERIEELTGVPAARLARAVEVLREAKRPALLYPREFDPSWRPALVALTEWALARSEGEPSFIGGLLRFNNSQGALDLGLLPPGGYGAGITEALAAGTVKALWLLSPERLTLDPATLAGVECLIVQDILPSELMKRADIVLPGAAFAEKAGTYTNLERRVQRITSAKQVPGLARADWRLLTDAARALGATYDYSGPRDVLREIAREVPAYREITWERIGKSGQQWQIASPSTPEPQPVAAD